MSIRIRQSVESIDWSLPRSKILFKYGMVVPALLYAVAWIIYPMVSLVRLSFNSGAGGTFVGLQNYVNVLSSPDFKTAFFNTLTFSVPAITLELLLGTLLALAYNSITWFKRTTQTLLLIPMVLTPLAVGLMFRWFFNTGLGIVNYVLGVVGLPQMVWLADPTLAMVTIILADVWQWTPFVFILVYAGLQTIPENLIEAAKMDGANRFQRLRYILLPQLYPILIMTALIRLIMALKSGDKIFAMTGGGPGSSTKTLTMLIYETAFSFLNTAEAAAMSLLFLISIIIVGNIFIAALGRVNRGR